MTQYGFFYNNLQCTGCRTCQVACKDKNNLRDGVLFRKVSTFETGSYPTPGYYHLSLACNHCENPACTEVCPAGATYKDEATGVVMHDDEKCIGCQSCTKACPYGHPQYVEALKIVQKCTFCHDLVTAGENPVCVDACPLRALEWGDVEELAQRHPEAVNSIAVLPDVGQTNPSLFIEARPAASDENFVQRYI